MSCSIMVSMLKNVTIGNVSHSAISSPCVNRQPADGRTVAVLHCAYAWLRDKIIPAHKLTTTATTWPHSLRNPSVGMQRHFSISRKMLEGQWEGAQSGRGKLSCLAPPTTTPRTLQPATIDDYDLLRQGSDPITTTGKECDECDSRAQASGSGRAISPEQGILCDRKTRHQQGRRLDLRLG